MRNKLLIWIAVYLIGIIVLVISGIQPMNWITYLSIGVGISGCGFAFLVKDGVGN